MSFNKKLILNEGYAPNVYILHQNWFKYLHKKKIFGLIFMCWNFNFRA